MGILIKLPIFTNPALPPELADNAAILYREAVNFLKSVSKNGGLLFAVITYFFLFTQCIAAKQPYQQEPHDAAVKFFYPQLPILLLHH